MSQHDFNAANGSGQAVRTDFNAALVALASLSSGASAPGTTEAYMWWFDTTNALLKQRNAADSGWVNVARLTASGFVPAAPTPQVLTPDTAGDVAWDLAVANVATLTVDDDLAISAPSNLEAGAVYRLVLTHSSPPTGGWAVTFDATFDFGAVAAPPLSVEDGDVDVLAFYCDGTNLFHRSGVLPERVTYGFGREGTQGNGAWLGPQGLTNSTGDVRLPMHRSGTITAMIGSADTITNGGGDDVEFYLYKNGSTVIYQLSMPTGTSPQNYVTGLALAFDAGDDLVVRISLNDLVGGTATVALAAAWVEVVFDY